MERKYSFSVFFAVNFHSSLVTTKKSVFLKSGFWYLFVKFVELGQQVTTPSNKLCWNIFAFTKWSGACYYVKISQNHTGWMEWTYKKSGSDSWMAHAEELWSNAKSPNMSDPDTRGKGDGKCNNQPPEMNENNERDENKTIWENIFQSLIIKSIKCRQAFVSFFTLRRKLCAVSASIKCYPHVNNEVKQIGGSAVPLACQKKVLMLKRFLSCGCQKTS